MRLRVLFTWVWAGLSLLRRHGPVAFFWHLIATDRWVPGLKRDLGFLPVARRIPGQEIFGAIDFPADGTEVPRRFITVFGGALSFGAAIDRIELLVDGRPAGLARIGINRLDYATAFKEPEAPVAGFSFPLDLAAVPHDRSWTVLTPLAHTMDGQVHALRSISLRLGKPATVPRLRSPDRYPSPPRRQEVLKIACFAHDLDFGGAQIYLYELLRRFPEVETGAEWTVVAPWKGPMAKRLRRLGARVHLTGEIPMDGGLHEDRIAEIAGWLQSEHFNAVVANTLGTFPAIEAAYGAGLPSLWAIHESYTVTGWFAANNRWNLDPAVTARVGRCFKLASSVLFVSDATRDLHLGDGMIGDLVTVPYGIDLGEIAQYRLANTRAGLRKKLRIPAEANVFVCVAIFGQRKNQSLLVQAFRGIAERDPAAQLFLVGAARDPYSEAVRQLCARLGLAERVHVCDVDSDPFRWYSVADLFVLPSDVESLPRSMLEAMGFGVPVAMSSAWGVPEVITDGVNGLLFEPSSIGEIERCLMRFLDMGPGERQKVGEAGRLTVAAKYDSIHYVRRYAEMLNALALPDRLRTEP